MSPRVPLNTSAKAFFLAAAFFAGVSGLSAANGKDMMKAGMVEPDWPQSAFDKSDVDASQIVTFAKKNEPASLDTPKTVPLALSIEVKPRDPVVVVELNSEVRAYPLTIVAAHEIINDDLAAFPSP